MLKNVTRFEFGLLHCCYVASQIWISISAVIFKFMQLIQFYTSTRDSKICKSIRKIKA